MFGSICDSLATEPVASHTSVEVVADFASTIFFGRPNPILETQTNLRLPKRSSEIRLRFFGVGMRAREAFQNCCRYDLHL